MKLSQDQIQDLFKFVRKHFVEHYDLQTELVDHLANGIEAQWQEYPERSFKDARLREFRKFGVGGFEEVVRKRRNAMSWRYFKITLRFCLEYFRWPRTMILITSAFLMFVCIRSVSPANKIYFVMGMLLVAAIIMLFKTLKNRRIYRAKIGLKKRWMLEENIYQFGDMLQILILPFHILNFVALRGNGLDDFYIELGLVIFSIFFLALCFVMIYVIPKKAEELLSETYPEYEMV